MSKMSAFEREVRIRPAFDCEVIQPCVHGSIECGTVPGRGHGRHNAEMHLIVRDAVAEVILVVNTGWDLPETPALVRSRDGARGAFVEFHSSVPRYEGHEPQGSTCDRWPVCYGDVGYTMADEPAELLVRKGTDAVWEWLESLHRESFPSKRPSGERGRCAVCGGEFNVKKDGTLRWHGDGSFPPGMCQGAGELPVARAEAFVSGGSGASGVTR